MVEAAPDFTPVHLLTGFLGSGKTTLLQKLLADEALADCAVLINEWGEIGLDHHLLERIDDTIVMLPSGCVCCTIRGELSDAVKSLLTRRTRGEIPLFRRMVIESTGLADPFPILSTLHADPVLRHHFRLANVITTIDAVNAPLQLDSQEECAKQIAVADRLILTKTDLATSEQIADVLARVAALNPDAPLWRAFDDELPITELLEGDHGRRSAFHAGAVVNRHPSIRSFALEFAEPIDWTMFGVWLTMLLHRHGKDILRIKGILNLQDQETPVAIHAVQHLVHPPVHMKAWPDEARESRIVFIVRGLDGALIERSLRVFQGLR